MQVRTSGLSMLGEVGLRNAFLFREPECDPVPELMISRQKNWIIGYRFSLWKYVDRINRISTQFAI